MTLSAVPLSQLRSLKGFQHSKTTTTSQMLDIASRRPTRKTSLTLSNKSWSQRHQLRLRAQQIVRISHLNLSQATRVASVVRMVSMRILTKSLGRNMSRRIATVIQKALIASIITSSLWKTTVLTPRMIELPIKFWQPLHSLLVSLRYSLCYFNEWLVN